eukprot:TRINITY_DN7722_c0_g1_i1.p1 TRINITY_DN7722_c0_g1~~TRINITY_DN7722_c0_g1_i1.p1  ORF type:complete len:102 (+),score=17.53 TRINITY_DN7722_c0_g1_i1:515-820(+)
MLQLLVLPDEAVAAIFVHLTALERSKVLEAAVFNTSEAEAVVDHLFSLLLHSCPLELTAAEVKARRWLQRGTVTHNWQTSDGAMAFYVGRTEPTIKMTNEE